MPMDGVPGTESGTIADRQAQHDQQRGDREVGHPLDGPELLEADEHGHEGHPAQAHDAEREERRHERPAAAHAPGAVGDPQIQPAQPPVAPALGEEHQRAAALGQADVLERGELVERRSHDHRSRDPVPRPVPGDVVEGRDVRQRAQQPEGAQPRRGPGDQVARHEERRGVGRGAVAPLTMPAAQPVVEQHGGRDRREHHRGHHHHPDRQEEAQAPEVRARHRVHAAHALAGDHPGDDGEHKQHAEQGQPLARQGLGWQRDRRHG